MPRRLPSILAALAALPLLASTAFAAAFPDQIPLANGWRPEGIATGRGLTAYVGSLADGDITRVNLRTGVRDDAFIEGPGTSAVGLEYEAGADRLWVAGGMSGEVRVYDASTGEELATYSFGAGRFVNDVVVTPDAAYATDSFGAELLVIPLGADGSLPDAGDTTTLPLSGDYEHQVGGFNANGIEAFGGAILIPNSTTGQLFAVDPATGVAVELLGEDSITAADGILLVGNTLYVVQNQLAQVSVWRIQGGAVVPVDVITDVNPDEVPGDLDVPTTVAFAGGSLWAANARFSTPPTPTTAYWITRIPIH